MLNTIIVLKQGNLKLNSMRASHSRPFSTKTQLTINCRTKGTDATLSFTMHMAPRVSLEA